MRVAYLGPKGTYSEEAATEYFSDKFEPLFCNSLDGVVESVVTGQADYSVLPIENSTNGAVNLALDALLFYPGVSNIEVCGEARIPVRHQLYSRARSLTSIKTVYSHPQVWGQVTQWLQKHLPDAKYVDCDSTSAAVALALAPPSTTLDPETPPPRKQANSVTTAALGGPLTSETHPLVTDCADNPANTTRFLILRRKEQQSVQGQTVVAVAHNTSAPQLLTSLASQNLTPKFMAPRPAKGNWKYSYFLELEEPDADTRAAKLGFSIIGRHG